VANKTAVALGPAQATTVKRHQALLNHREMNKTQHQTLTPKSARKASFNPSATLCNNATLEQNG